MHRDAARTASLALLIAFSAGVRAEPPRLVPCDELPAAVAAVAGTSETEAFGVATGAPMSVAAIRPQGEGGHSVLRFARGADAPREVELSGHVLGLAVAANGAMAYAVVHAVDRKGVVVRVELVRVDLATARVSVGPKLPSGAVGVALATDNVTLFVASRDEIRTFRLPGLESGPLFRLLGDNVGVSPIASSSTLIVAQRSRVVLADLSAPQSRDGLEVGPAVDAPAPLRGLASSAGDGGPVALAEDGRRWCVRAEALLPRTPAPAVLAEPPPAEPLPVEPPPVEAPPVEPVAGEARPPAPSPAEISAVEVAPAETFAPGAVMGALAGPAAGEVATVVFLGPDNILREAARVVPDTRGRFSVTELPQGAYRVVAAGKGGRVLICDPPFVTVRVDSKGAIEAPVLKVVRAQ